VVTGSQNGTISTWAYYSGEKVFQYNKAHGVNIYINMIYLNFCILKLLSNMFFKIIIIKMIKIILFFFFFFFFFILNIF